MTLGEHEPPPASRLCRTRVDRPAQRIRAVSNRLRATGMREDPNHHDLAHRRTYPEVSPGFIFGTYRAGGRGAQEDQRTIERSEQEWAYVS